MLTRSAAVAEDCDYGDYIGRLQLGGVPGPTWEAAEPNGRHFYRRPTLATLLTRGVAGAGSMGLIAPYAVWYPDVDGGGMMMFPPIVYRSHFWDLQMGRQTTRVLCSLCWPLHGDLPLWEVLVAFVGSHLSTAAQGISEVDGPNPTKSVELG